jgi:phage pi2 protein 07
LLAKRTSDYNEKNLKLRKEADELILLLWNEIEKTHLNHPEEIRKIQCENYGLVYFYRKNELEKIKALVPVEQSLS